MSIVLDRGASYNEATIPAEATEPQFTHRIQTWAVLLTGALLTMLIVASFLYGQFAPGI